MKQPLLRPVQHAKEKFSLQPPVKKIERSNPVKLESIRRQLQSPKSNAAVTWVLTSRAQPVLAPTQTRVWK
jgi:hypothetical protein